MSYRELRDLSESLRVLGYPRRIGLESFRKPNFELVADILLWLIHQYDPQIDVYDGISNEEDRVDYVKTCVTILADKSLIRLNPKRIYASDGYAAKELLKITSILYKSLQTAQSNVTTPSTFQPASVTSLQNVRESAGDIINRGAALHSDLTDEATNRDDRRRVIGRPLDMRSLEKSIRQEIRVVTNEMNDLLGRLDKIGSDEGTLTSKIKKRTQELNRAITRLQSMKTVRPAFMDEFERLEKELQALYKNYVERHRNLHYLEHQVYLDSRADEARQVQATKALHTLQKKLREDEDQTMLATGEEGFDPMERQRFGSDQEGSLSRSESDFDNFDEAADEQVFDDFDEGQAFSDNDF
eukprot:TRINITY_DN33449_c0_g1_i1.p1 TRINITY_DN33449_c0_g1~~TRINITY_DN33449_c0_g1_i1.p1  ORF type:complete len:356 (-),score=43.99 TRINITY_DN33449_c0_g1_i1:187-1254(-)